MLVLQVGSGPLQRYANDPSVLRQNGMLCERVATEQQAIEYLRLYDYDVVVLDQQPRDWPCDEIVRRLRLSGCTVPIVIVADMASSQVKARALNQGADDFITVPCTTDELFARIRAVVRRSKGHADSVLTAGRAEFRLDRREVRVGGKRLPLSRREFMLLELMFLKKGSVVTKAALFNHLYCGQDEREIKTLDVIVSRLRKKLTVAGMPPLIETVWGFGYTLKVPDDVGVPMPMVAVSPLPWGAGFTGELSATGD
jgi:two-component system cell cycle response regulator CtrA